MSGTNTPPVIYALGDSLSDAGNAYLLTASPFGSLFSAHVIPVSPPFYQETYTATVGGLLTADVFSNGPVWVQELAGDLGITAPAPGQVGATASTLTVVLQEENLPDPTIASFIGTLEAQQNATVDNPYLLVSNGAASGTDFAI